MKVIKKGRPQKGWAEEFECTGSGNNGGGCGAILLVEQDDLFKTFHHCRDETDTFVTFKCSQCGVLTDIGKYPSKIPINIASNLKSQETWEENRKHRCIQNGCNSLAQELSNYCPFHKPKATPIPSNGRPIG